MSRRSFTLFAALLFAGLTAVPADAAQPPSAGRIEVSDAQIVTVNGRFESLRDVLGRLLSDAGVEVREFGVSDRPVQASYERAPLAVVLRGLLRGENYAVGVRAGSDEAEIAWVRLFGPERGGPVETIGGEPVLRTPLGVTEDVLEAALSSDDAMERKRAANEVAAVAKMRPEVIEAFLDTDASALADEYAQYPHTIDMLDALKRVHPDATVRSRIYALIRMVRLRNDNPNAALEQQLERELRRQAGAL